MVWDKPSPTLNRLDWAVLGYLEESPLDTHRLPSVRLDIPFPPARDNLYRLAHHMAGLAEEFHRASQNPVHRSAVVEMHSLVRAKTKYFLQLKREWEYELRREIKLRGEEGDDAVHQELSGNAGRTGLSVVRET